jgi:copper resistance protein B
MMRLIRTITAFSLATSLIIGSAQSLADGTGLQADPSWPKPIHDDMAYGQLMFDRLEMQSIEGSEQLLWDAQAWYGKDLNRFWLETEGSYNDEHSGEIENLDLQYSRRISPFWDLQTGIGTQTSFGAGARQERYYGIIGFQGLAPYWFEIDSNLRISDDGDTWLDLEVEYDWRLTQKLILQARAETSYAFSEVEDFEQGQGLNGITTGLRLRYHLSREFAPYIGVSASRLLGDTKDLAESEGDEDSTATFVAGVRIWF